MKKGGIYEGTVTRMEFPNKGIILAEGEKVVVKNALPGQRVSFAVQKSRHGSCQGRLLEVLKPSGLETADRPCSHAGICGGCLYQTVPYETQLEIKAGQVKALLDSVISGYEWEGILPSPLSEGYRNKMEYSFGDAYKGGPLALGMHRRGSFHDIATVTDCRIVHPDFTRVLEATRAYFAEAGVQFYHKLRHTGCLRHLLVRRAARTGEILAALVTSSEMQGGNLLEGWKDLLLRMEPELEGRFAGILHIVNDSLADVVQDGGTSVLHGRGHFYEKVLGLQFKISTFSFFQTNTLGAEVLYGKAREYVGQTGDKVVFDLYSGTGTIAQILAPVARKVVGVEIVEEAVAAARASAASNGLTNCDFLAGDVLKVVDGLADRPDLIVLDPPRDGVHPKALQKIIGFGVERMVYISCKPTSLARDLVALTEGGYRAERVCCVDMFPGTANVETVIQMTSGI